MPVVYMPMHQSFSTLSLVFSASASKNKLRLFTSAGGGLAGVSPIVASFSRLKSSALLRSLGGGEDTGVFVPHPFLFSLAQVPQLEKYAPALAFAFERSGA